MDIRSCSSSHSRLALKYNDTVGEVRCHDKIVLNDEGSLLGVQDESGSLCKSSSSNNL